MLAYGNCQTEATRILQAHPKHDCVEN